MDHKMKICEECKRRLDKQHYFYFTNNIKKYPDGYLNICKNCITSQIDNQDSNTYLWILQECDVPYLFSEWNKLLLRYSQSKTKTTGMTILGRYLSKMKLMDFKNYRWRDTSFLNQIEQKEVI